MLRTLSRTFTAVAVLFGSVGMAHAFSSPTTVYSSGDLHSTDNATEMTQNLIAEPFSISAASQIVAVDFYTREVLTGAHNATGVALASTSDSFKGAFYWYILNDAAGTPGSILYSGVASVAGIDFTRLDLSGFAVCPTCSGFDVITNSITIPSVLLDAGVRYWLVLHNGNPAVDQTAPGSGMFWDTTNTNNSNAVQPTFESASPPLPALFAPHTGGPDLTHVYRITGQICDPGDCTRVAEPGTLALLGAGIGLISVVRRFRRKK